MKYRTIFLSIILLCILVNSKVIYANNNELETNAISDSDKENIWDEFKIVYSNEKPETDYTIEHFDVNTDGTIALVFTNSTIGVYDFNGEYLYMISFDTVGSYEVFWLDNNLVILDERQDNAVEIDSSGNLVDIFVLDYNYGSNQRFYPYFMSTKREVDDTKFVIRNNLGVLNVLAKFFAYSQLVKIDSNGTETILYDVSYNQRATVIIYSILIMGGLTIVVTILIRQIKKSRMEYNELIKTGGKHEST